MFSPATELVDAAGVRIHIAHVIRGRELLGRVRGKLRRGAVRRVGVRPGGRATILVTASGRRLSAAAGQRVLVRGRAGLPCWRPAGEVRVGVLVFCVADGILGVDRVTCVVNAEKASEPWITVSTETGTVFAEEILCRAS